VPAPRHTKIVATIGPASDTPDVLDSLIAAGMDCARISVAHGPLEEALRRIDAVRAAADRAGRINGVLADLPGPKVRVSAFPDGGVHLADGSTVELVVADGAGSTENRIGVELDELLDGLTAGDHIALGDGAVQLDVTRRTPKGAYALVTSGGWVQGRPGVALPSGRFSLRAPTARDLELISGLCAADVDMVAVSFVRDRTDIEAVAQAITPGRDGARPLIVAKIETEDAVEHLDEIIAAADAVMVARGDLGIRLPVEDVPHLQRRIIQTAVSYGRPVITATQMLESMVRSPIPTRAEVADVTTAVLSGTSAVMLSGETAVGAHPAAAVETMARIARRAEAEFDNEAWGKALGRLQSAAMADVSPQLRIVAAVSAAAWRATLDADATAIIACTRSGATARAVTRFRPAVPVLAATPSVRSAAQLSLSWGVVPLLIVEQPTVDEVVETVIRAAKAGGHVSVGDVVAIMVGSAGRQRPLTDKVRLVVVA
jgi:pyruvate kinase